jgi:hypothetical protein
MSVYREVADILMSLAFVGLVYIIVDTVLRWWESR